MEFGFHQSEDGTGLLVVGGHAWILDFRRPLKFQAKIPCPIYSVDACRYPSTNGWRERPQRYLLAWRRSVREYYTGVCPVKTD